MKGWSSCIGATPGRQYHSANCSANYALHSPGDRQILEHREQAVHLLLCVVMNEANPQHPAARFDTQAFRKAKGVIIPVPGKDPVSGKGFGELARGMTREPDGDSWD